MFKKSAAPSAGGYNLTKSLRFRSSASAYLNRTPATTGTGGGKTFTYSCWAKLDCVGNYNWLLIGGLLSSSADCALYIDSVGQMKFNDRPSGAYVNSTAVYRDPAAWYHFIFAVDTTQATAANRIKMYVNGIQTTSFSSTNYPAQNTVLNIGINQPQRICTRDDGNTSSFYQAETNFIDGQQLTSTSFGSTNSTTGVWQPIAYTGTYGTNGFYLKFTDTSSTAALGTDYSGNSNTWTVNNISLTAGTTYDSMTDVPTLTSATTANYAVLNPLASGATLSNANLKMTGPSASHGISPSSIAFESSTSNYYCEVYIDSTNVITNGIAVGLALTTANTKATGTKLSALTGGWGWQNYLSNGGNNFGASASYSLYNTGAVYAAGDILGIQVNNGSLVFYKNGTSQGTAATGISGMVCFAASAYDTDAASFNFGQQPFVYTPPTGALRLNTYNLPTSTIVAGNKVMDATTYTGTGATQSVTNTASFKPDLLWIKDRSRAGAFHDIVDSVRGVNLTLSSNSTAAEATGSFITSLNSNGFTLPANTTSDNYFTNVSGDTFVGWQWQAGQGTTSSNTNGSITSTVSVNATAGFSIVTWTMPSTAGITIGHGLGVAPAMYVVKSRAVSSGWALYHQSLGNTGYLLLQSTAAFATDPTAWSNTSPTSNVFTIGTSFNGLAGNYLAYCWAEVAGFSKFGSYVGNGSTDGPFVYTGFRPKYILIKATSGTLDWAVEDSTRSPYNQANAALYPDLSAAETTAYDLRDFLSNGFKIRTSDGNSNTNGTTYIYAAFAENPFKNALAR